MADSIAAMHVIVSYQIRLYGGMPGIIGVNVFWNGNALSRFIHLRSDNINCDYCPLKVVR